MYNHKQENNMHRIEDLDEYLKKFPTYEVLLAMGQYSIDLYIKNYYFYNYPVFMNGRKYSVTITQHGLAYLAFRSIYVSNDGKSKNFTEMDLMRAVSIYNDLYEPFVDDHDFTSLMIRMGYEQFSPWQVSNFRFLLARYYSIFNNSNLKNDFKKCTSLSLENYIYIGMLVYFLLYQNKNCCVPLEKVLISQDKKLKNILTSENIENFLILTSGDYWTIRKIAKEHLSIPGYEKYEFNPLIKYPIIKADRRFFYSINCPYIIPNIILLLNKVTDGIYWILRDYYKQMDSSEFLGKFGDLFKEYVGILLKEYFGEENVIDLDQELAEISGKKADWWVKSKMSEIIIECKSSLIVEPVRRVADLKLLKVELSQKFSRAIEQLLSTDEQLPKASGVKRYLLIITFEELYFWEMPAIKNLIYEDTEKFYIMSISELEAIEPWIRKYGIENMFAKKMQIDKEEDMSKGRDFFAVCKYIDDTLALENSFLDRVYQEIYEKIK